MATNNNTTITKTIRDGMKIEQAVDQVPTEIGSKILPVFLVNQASAGAASQEIKCITTSVPATMLTTSATKRTFLSSASLSFGSRNQDSLLIESLTVTPIGGAATQIMRIVGGGGTAGVNTEFAVHDFAIPIELEPNTTIVFADSGFDQADSTIFYYEI